MAIEVTIFPAALELPLPLLVELAEEAKARHTTISGMLSEMLIDVANERAAMKSPFDPSQIPALTGQVPTSINGEPFKLHVPTDQAATAAAPSL